MSIDQSIGNSGNWILELDRILRGKATQLSELKEGDIRIPTLGIACIIVVLGFVYGLCMGVYALIYGVEQANLAKGLMQTFASIVKVPLLYFMTLVITFPSLYVFNAIVGSRLQIGALLRLLIASLAVTMSVLASLGPVQAFFAASSPNYGFVVLLNVGIFAVSGALGLTFLIQTLNRMAWVTPKNEHKQKGKFKSIKEQTEKPAINPQLAPNSLEHPKGMSLGPQVKIVFACWILLFSSVGAQSGWLLRPFIGSPNLPFEWFRDRESNFFEAVIRLIFG